MKYRLGLKLGLTPGLPGKKGTEAYVSWAMVRLGKPPVQSGDGQLPYNELGQEPGEVRIVVYDRPDDMLEPMPLAQYEARIRAVTGTLPDNCTVVRVPFDPAAYTTWRTLEGVADGHEARSAWAKSLESPQ